MTAFTNNAGNVALVRRLALRAAIFLVVTNRASATVMFAFIHFICH
jgi:hypothetical protein